MFFIRSTVKKAKRWYGSVTAETGHGVEMGTNSWGWIGMGVCRLLWGWDGDGESNSGDAVGIRHSCGDGNTIFYRVTLFL